MPTAWDRLTDATAPESAGDRLSIITLGHVHGNDIEALTTKFQHVEQLVLDVAPREPLSRHRAELNRAVDAASNDWILIVRERERVDEALAVEIGAATRGGKARGFRIRSVPIYAGALLRIGEEEADVRLFHRRYYLRYAEKGEWTRLAIQGTVVRLSEPLRSMSFDSVEAHREFLARDGVARSPVAHTVRFILYLLAARTLDRPTLRYLWIEAAFVKR